MPVLGQLSLGVGSSSAHSTGLVGGAGYSLSGGWGGGGAVIPPPFGGNVMLLFAADGDR